MIFHRVATEPEPPRRKVSNSFLASLGVHVVVAIAFMRMLILNGDFSQTPGRPTVPQQQPDQEGQRHEAEEQQLLADRQPERVRYEQEASREQREGRPHREHHEEAEEHEAGHQHEEPAHDGLTHPRRPAEVI